MANFSPFDVTDEQQLLTDVVARQNYTTNTTYDQAIRAAQIRSANPWMPVGTALALGKANASPEAIAAVAKAAGKKAVTPGATQNPVQQEAQNKNIWQRWIGYATHDNPLYKGLKAGSRWLAAGAQWLPEQIANSASDIFDDNSDINGTFASTTLGQMFQNGNLQGEGFFPGEKLVQKQREKAREYRSGAKLQGDKTFTVGRAAAQLLFAPGSKAYNTASGIVDAAIMLGADPVGKAMKAAGIAAKAPGLIPTADDVAVLSRKLAEYGAAGLSKAEAADFDASKWGKWIQGNRRARRLVENLAGENDVTRIIEMFDGKISVDNAVRLANTSEPEKVMGILGDAATRMPGEAGAGRVLLPENVRDVAGTGVVSQRMPLYKWFKQGLFAEMPKGFVSIAGTEQDNVTAYKNVANYLKKMGFEIYGENADPRAKEILAQAAKAYSATGNKVDVKQLDKLFVGKKGIVATALRDNGAQEDVVKAVVGGVQRKLNELRNYNVAQLGNLDDGGFVQGLLDSNLIDDATANQLLQMDISGKIKLEELRLQGPGALVEMANRVQVLPDPRVVGRLMNNPFYKFSAAHIGAGGARFGEQPWLLRTIEAAQNDVWRPLALMTGGYILRNMADAQIRIAATGGAGLFNHPIQWLQYVVGSRAVGTINKGGRFLFDEDLADMSPVIDDLESYVHSMGLGAHTAALDPVNTMDRLVRTNSFAIANRGSDVEGWTTGMVDNLRQIHKDPLMSLYARISHLDIDEQRKVLISFLESDNGKRHLKTIRDYLEKGVVVADHRDGRQVIVPFKNAQNADVEEIVDLWWEKLTKSKANNILKNNEDLRVISAYNAVPAGPSEMVTAGDDIFDIIEKNDYTPGNRVTRIVETEDGPKEIGYAILEKNVTGTGKGRVTSYKVVPIADFEALDPDEGATAVRNFLQQMSPENTPEFVKVATRVKKGTDGYGVKQGWDRVVNEFFNHLYGEKVVKKLERSPLFRQKYYETVADNIQLLSPQEAQGVLDNIYAFSDEAFVGRKGAVGWSAEKKAARYVGNDDVWEKLKTRAAAANGEATIQDLQDYASGRAVYHVEQTFFSTANKTNIEDAMRVVAPFAPAWKEVLGTYVKLLADDPSRIRKAQRTFTGAINWDDDQDGIGFFYKDPTTNQYMFQFPASTAIYKLFTGSSLGGALEAPVKRLSIGLNVLPALGPMAQIAASQIIPNTPSADDLKNFLLPYGESTFSSLTPGWVKKAYEAVSGDPGQAATMYGQEYGNVVRALAASGQYNMDDQGDRDSLFNDAKKHARVMMLMRVASQFLGPTAGSSEYQVQTKQGPEYSSFLISEYQRLKEEDYESSVSKFLELYGDEAYPYLASKTQATRGGLEATREFSDWETENSGLVNSHRDVVGYLAPAGDKFSYATFNRQTEGGARKRLSGREMIEAAELRVGSAKYRAARLKVGPYPNDKQRSILRSYREELNKQYPGFPVVAQFNPGEFKDTVRKLQLLVEDPRTKDNETAQSIRDYLYFRDKALAKAQSLGYVDLSAKALANVRGWLVQRAQNLIEDNPNFARVYDKELSIEVED